MIGYAELLDYIDEAISYDEALRLIKQNTRRFAKRQMTWYRNSDSITLFEDTKACLAQLDQFLRVNC